MKINLVFPEKRKFNENNLAANKSTTNIALILILYYYVQYFKIIMLMRTNKPMEIDSYSNATVFVIDDDEEIRRALKWLLESVKLNVICFESAALFLEQFNPSAQGCIVTDVRMPLLSGLQLLERLKALNNRLPVIVITGHGDIPMAVKAMKMGAIDFIIKPFNDQNLLEKIQVAVASNAVNNEFEVDAHLSYPDLTKREKEVVTLIAQGMLNKQIALELNISISTVEFHRSRLMKKLGAKNLAQLIKTYLIQTKNV